VNGGGFRADVGTKAGFPARNSSDNGERARSLLCGREALAKPAGAAALHWVQTPALCESCPPSEMQKNFVRTKFRVSGRA